MTDQVRRFADRVRVTDSVIRDPVFDDAGAMSIAPAAWPRERFEAFEQAFGQLRGATMTMGGSMTLEVWGECAWTARDLFGG